MHEFDELYNKLIQTMLQVIYVKYSTTNVLRSWTAFLSYLAKINIFEFLNTCDLQFFKDYLFKIGCTFSLEVTTLNFSDNRTYDIGLWNLN